MSKTKFYICVGENWVDGTDFGYCGDVHTLDKWLEIIYPSKLQQAKEYFEGAKEKEILDYIYLHNGKRLKDYSKWRV